MPPWFHRVPPLPHHLTVTRQKRGNTNWCSLRFHEKWLKLLPGQQRLKKIKAKVVIICIFYLERRKHLYYFSYKCATYSFQHTCNIPRIDANVRHCIISSSAGKVSPIQPCKLIRYSPQPIAKTLKSVPTMANIKMLPILSKKSRSYREYAESRTSGGSNTLKKKVYVNLGNGCSSVSTPSPYQPATDWHNPTTMPMRIRTHDSGQCLDMIGV